MKLAALTLPLFALSLSACGETASEPKSMAEVAEAASEMIQPLAGEYTSTTELVEFSIPGQPPEIANRLREMMSGQFSQSSSSCLTQEEAEKGFEDKFREMGEGANGLKCEFDQFDVDGNNVDAKLSCSGPGGSVANLTMDGTVGEESQTIDMEMAMSGGGIPGGEMNLKMKIVSERTGDCT